MIMVRNILHVSLRLMNNYKYIYIYIYIYIHIYIYRYVYIAVCAQANPICNLYRPTLITFLWSQKFSIELS